MQAAGRSNLKRVSLELGGKSPFIIFKDCDCRFYLIFFVLIPTHCSLLIGLLDIVYFDVMLITPIAGLNIIPNVLTDRL